MAKIYRIKGIGVIEADPSEILAACPRCGGTSFEIAVGANADDEDWAIVSINCTHQKHHYMVSTEDAECEPSSEQ